MRSLILASVLVCSSFSIMANQCDVELQGELTLENKVLTVTLNDNTKIKIDEYQALYVDGVHLSLNSEQQSWVNNYYNGIYHTVPQVAGIATDAVKLASLALNEVFTELLGSNSAALDNLTQKLDELDEQIQYNFYAQNGSLRIHSESFENDDFFGQEWESNFEAAIEEVVSESIGSLMVAIGTELMFSGGDMKAFEKKMERFGEQLEHTMEFQTAALEDKADELCASLIDVDSAESQLQKHIKQLADLDILQIKPARNAM